MTIRYADERNGFGLPPHLSLANYSSSLSSLSSRGGGGSDGSSLTKYVAGMIDPTLSWKDIAWLQQNTKLPIVLKGVATREDALLAKEAKVAGVLVSNHGARQLDTVLATVGVIMAFSAYLDC
jgi:isopentenyl diphosphate isomerase/L-lactate dehydrogenase-like FMN-dependent dehydrogenase